MSSHRSLGSCKNNFYSRIMVKYIINIFPWRSLLLPSDSLRWSMGWKSLATHLIETILKIFWFLLAKACNNVFNIRSKGSYIRLLRYALKDREILSAYTYRAKLTPEQEETVRNFVMQDPQISQDVLRTFFSRTGIK